ncbi:hypothetical protein SteCoe_23745 [Stentor coeruleus]|uniref:Uncharacterized protein n=1 Tax=Stentor coeruleus TaxID=5963 RepID=A0A1R2BJ85_9CILI|nr:hypothetical protein SteCoe_23745 [Stentor coeruleus]
MSLLSLSKSLTKAIPKSPLLASTLKKSSKSQKKLGIILQETNRLHSLKLIKQVSYLCNYKFKSQGESNLVLAHDILENYIKTCRQKSKTPPESIFKLLAITLINQSIFYEKNNPTKAMSSAIQAAKICSQNKFSSADGKFLTFVSKLRECELCLISEKYDMCIMSAQDVLKDVLKKLKNTKKPKTLQRLGAIAINAFHKIGTCEEFKGNKLAAEQAYLNAESLQQQYMKNDYLVEDLDNEVYSLGKVHRRKSPVNTSHSERETVYDRLKIPIEIKSINDLNGPKSSKASIEHEGRSLTESRVHKIPGRYYSNQQLQRLTQLLNQNKDPIVLSSDHYFYAHIFKSLRMDTDIHLKPETVTDQVKAHIDNLMKHKEIIKSRRKIRNDIKSDSDSSEYVDKQVDRIEEEFEQRLKVQEIKMKSKLKSKVYKNLLKTINLPSRNKQRVLPSQTLHFKQPQIRRLTTQGTTLRAPTLKTETQTKTKHKLNIYELNQEIEDQLDALYNDLHGSPKRPSSPTNREAAPCPLAKSAVKTRKKEVIIRKSLSRAVGGKNLSTKSFFKTELMKSL